MPQTAAADDVQSQAPAQARITALLLGLLLAALVAAALGVFWAAHRVDALSIEMQQAQVRATFEQYKQRLRSASVSELNWDEAVLNLETRFDPEWARALGVWLYESQSIERLVVYGVDDQPLYAVVDGAPADPIAEAKRCPATAAIASIRARENERGPLPRPADDFMTLIGTPIASAEFASCAGEAIVQVSILVQPDYGVNMPAGLRTPVVVLTKRLDEPTINLVAGPLQMAEARYEPAASPAYDAVSIGLQANDGTEVARFAWRAAPPGRTVLGKAAPWFGVGAVSLLCLTFAALQQLRRAQDLVRATAGRARRHAESLERMSAISRIGAWETRPGGSTLLLSRETARILGFHDAATRSRREVLARFCDASSDRVDAAISESMRSDTPFDLVATTLDTTGAPHTLRVQGRPIVANGAPVVEGTIQDITEQVRQEQELRRNTELLEQMSRIGEIGGWEYDVASRRLTFTEQTYRIYGIAPGARVSLSIIAALYAADDARQILTTLEHAVRTGAPWDLELSATTVDGRRIWVRGLGEAESVNGRVVRLFGTLQDTSTARAAATRLQDAIRRAEARNAEIQQFTFAASHDLQEPARKVQVLGSLLLTRHGATLDADARDCVLRIQRSSERMAVLIDDVLAYSRTAQQPAEPIAVALDAIAREAVDDLESLIENTDARVDIGPLPKVEGDPVQLRRLLQNLLANALKYRHPERAPKVSLRARMFNPEPGATWCRLAVADNGVGFDNKHAESIFLPFTRLQHETSSEGSGIGLAIVRRIAESHGGRVWAEGRPGDGACFVLEIPLRQQHRAPKAG